MRKKNSSACNQYSSHLQTREYFPVGKNVFRTEVDLLAHIKILKSWDFFLKKIYIITIICETRSLTCAGYA